MKTKTITLYTAKELKEENPEGFDHAHEEFKAGEREIFSLDEIMSSLKAVFKASGIRLTDWEISEYASHSFVDFDMDEEVKDLEGVRAQAWLENNLLSGLRIPFRGSRRWELAKYGQYYRPGMIEPCPFTGVCYDEDFIDALRKEIKEGSTIGEAYKNLADVAANLIEGEIESRMSEDYFLETAEINEWMFTIDGEME